MKFLGRARHFLQGIGAPSEARVQYYSVQCPLGHRVRGQRTEGYQAIRCPACGEGVFVLPTSPLPEPIAPARSPAKAPATFRTAVQEGPVELRDPGDVSVEIEEATPPVANAEIIWDEEPNDVAARGDRGRSPAAPAESVPSIPTNPAGTRGAMPRSQAHRPSPDGVKAPKGPSVERAPQRKGAGEGGRPKPSARPLAASETDSFGHGSTASEAASRAYRVWYRRPIAIFAAVAFLVIATIALRSWRHRLQELPQVARVGKTEGIPALLAGRYDKANQILSAARAAVVSLGGNVDDAEEILHAADEAALLVDLLPDPLESLLDEAGRSDPQTWAGRFSSLYQGRAIVLVATIASTPGSNGSERYEIDYVVLPQGGGGAGPQRHGRIDLSGLELLLQARPGAGETVNIGARLASFQFDSAHDEWVIGLEPQSGVTIKYPESLQTLGWPGESHVEVGR